MGTEYALADDQNRRIFELGKGGWSIVFRRRERHWVETIVDHVADGTPVWSRIEAEPPDPPVLACEADMVRHVVAMWIDYIGHTPAHVAYAANVALELWRFFEAAGGQVRLLNDCDDSWHEAEKAGYVTVGSRYRRDEDDD